MNATSRTTRLSMLAALALTACGPGQVLDRGEVATAADGSKLPAEILASIVAEADGLPVTRDIVERLAHRWVEYTLFAHRIVAGDPLLDEYLVRKTMWPEIEQALVEGFHRQLIDVRVGFDDSTADSVFEAGDYRLIDHILVAVPESAGAAERQRARTSAERIRTQVLTGVPWARLNELNDDPGARRNGGSLGVIRRGRMAPAFERVAFALDAGSISDVVETSFGFHVIRRRSLGQVRAEFAVAVREAIEQDFTAAYLEELVDAWGILLEDDAPDAMREAAGAPLRWFGSSRVIGRYRDGRFTVADFVRWLQVLPLQQQAMVGSAGDEALRRMASSMIRNEVLLLEAKAADVAVDPGTMEDVRRLYAADVARVQSALRLTTVLADESTPEDRTRGADQAVLVYLQEIVANLDDVVVVPAFLGAALREESKWVISERGLDRAVQRTQEARLAMSLERREQ